MTSLAREMVNAYTSTFRFPDSTAQERMPDQEFQKTFIHGQSTPLWSISIRKKTYTVSKPIKVHIYFEGNLFFAENESLVVVGTGSSPTEAIDELCKHIIHFYKYYKRLTIDNLTGDAIRLKKVYETLFVEQN